MSQICRGAYASQHCLLAEGMRAAQGQRWL